MENPNSIRLLRKTLTEVIEENQEILDKSEEANVLPHPEVYEIMIECILRLSHLNELELRLDTEQDMLDSTDSAIYTGYNGA